MGCLFEFRRTPARGQFIASSHERYLQYSYKERVSRKEARTVCTHVIQKKFLECSYGDGFHSICWRRELDRAYFDSWKLRKVQAFIVWKIETLSEFDQLRQLLDRWAGRQRTGQVPNMRKTTNGTVPRDSFISARCLNNHYDTIGGKQLTAGLDEVSQTNQRIVRASHDCCRNTEYRWNHKTREPPIEVEYCPTLNLGLGDGKSDMTVVESATDITWRYRRGYLLYVGNRTNNTYRGTRNSPPLS